jgi:hypothetical protein
LLIEKKIKNVNSFENNISPIKATMVLVKIILTSSEIESGLVKPHHYHQGFIQHKVVTVNAMVLQWGKSRANIKVL